MPISLKRVREVIEYKNEYGMHKTLETFEELSRETVKRYERAARNNGIEVKPHGTPKIFIFDLEMAPMEVYAWQTGKQYISHDRILKPKSIISWAGKWLDSDEIVSHKVTRQEAIDREDGRIMKKLWKYMDKAQVLIGHNMKGFDRKEANTSFTLNDMSPPSPYKIIDTLKEARKHFSFASNTLDYLTYLTCDEEKKKVHFPLWHRCVNESGKDNNRALGDMETYNRQDIRATEDLFYKLRPWMSMSGVNLALFCEGDIEGRCGKCTSRDITLSDNYYYTTVNRYKTYRCNHCGGVGRVRHSDLTAEDKRNLIRPV